MNGWTAGQFSGGKKYSFLIPNVQFYSYWRMGRICFNTCIVKLCMNKTSYLCSVFIFIIYYNCNI